MVSTNKRQRKKQFKKIHGMNPAQYEKWEREQMPKILSERGIVNAEKLEKAIREAVKKMGEVAIEAAKILTERMDAWAEAAKLAAGFQETENLLRKSNTLPEGADKELLRHIGIRVDRDGWAYDFYYDEANEEYFVEALAGRRTIWK